MSRALLEQVRLLANGARLLADRCVAGLEPDRERARALAESSPSIVTPLNRVIGYENAAKVAKHAVAARVTIRQAVLELGFVERGEIDEADLDRLLDVRSMTRPARLTTTGAWTANGAAPIGATPFVRPSTGALRVGQYQPVAWLCAHAPHGEPYVDAM